MSLSEVELKSLSNKLVNETLEGAFVSGGWKAQMATCTWITVERVIDDRSALWVNVSFMAGADCARELRLLVSNMTSRASDGGHHSVVFERMLWAVARAPDDARRSTSKRELCDDRKHHPDVLWSKSLDGEAPTVHQLEHVRPVYDCAMMAIARGLRSKATPEDVARWKESVHLNDFTVFLNDEFFVWLAGFLNEFSRSCTRQ